jgi:uncharacterized membrane protein YozB (DUF420 family)
VNAPEWVQALPAVNAGLNTVATVLLITGYALVRRGRIAGHRKCMLSAFGVSIAFLACYVVYHAALHAYTGEPGRRFTGTGPVRSVYFSILISHVALAAAVPVLALASIYRAWKQNWTSHKRIARVTWPIWVYVSVTGVIIYVMLYHWPTVA